jgi:hypothetical protein
MDDREHIIGKSYTGISSCFFGTLMYFLSISLLLRVKESKKNNACMHGRDLA